MRASLALVLSLSAALTNGQTVITVTKTFTRTISSTPAGSCTVAPTSVTPTTTTQPTTTAPTSTAPIVTPTHAPINAAPLALVGVNIAGFDFGCGVDGTCSIVEGKGAYPPLPQYGGPNGIGQMAFFRGKDNFNVFRLPVGWQYLNQGVLGQLDATAFGKYDELVQACLGLGAYCVIDIHNYARYDGQIIGQGGVDPSEFAGLWASLATHYADQPKVIFGLMNEPHDIPNIYAWAGALQGAVGAIRSSGATSHYILLPGNDWASAQYFVANSADALSRITNLDGSTTNLIFDVHKYSDSDNSGTHAECTTDNISSAFSPLAEYLRSTGRQAILSEFGGGNTQSCVNYVCAQTDFIQQNSDVYLGYIGWSAGSFGTDYVLSEVPNLTTGEDTPLVGACLVPAQIPAGLPDTPTEPTGPTTTEQPPTTTEEPTPTTTYNPPDPTQTEWGQCGGQGWSGPKTCPAGIPCKCYSDYYCQCTRY